MNICGIDQSLTDTGLTFWSNGEFSWATINTEKTKDTKNPSIDYTRRLIQIADNVEKMISEKNIDLIAIEGMSFSSTGAVVFDLGGLSHILRARFISLGKKFIVIPPTTLKKYWFGKGNANKDEMLQATIDRGYNIPMLKNYGTKKQPIMKMNDNVVDSMALCIFAKDMVEGKLSEDFLKNIEKSEEVFIIEDL